MRFQSSLTALRSRVADATVRRLFRHRAGEAALLTIYERAGWPFLLKLASCHYSYPAPSRRVCDRWGIRFEVDISTYHGWSVYFRRADYAHMTACAAAGDVVLDVGANIGATALRFAQQVGDSGHVYAFEPQASIYAQCIRNMALNPQLHCTCEPMGRGSSTGDARLAVLDGRNPGTGSIVVAPHAASAGVSERIRLTTLDQFAEERRLSRIDVIKIDVEGYEWDVLQGAEEVLNRFMPVLILELVDEHQQRHGHSVQELLAWLETRGYEARNPGSGKVVRSEDMLRGCSMDVFCRPPARD